MKYDKGQELFNLAIQDYDSAIELVPNDVALYINRGNIVVSSERFLNRYY